MKEKTRETVSQAVNQVCSRLRQIVPQAVQMAGEEFSGEVTIKIALNCGGLPSKPKISFSF